MWCLAVALITEVLQGGLTPNEPFFISDISLLKLRMIVKLSIESQDRTCKSSVLLFSILVGASLPEPWVPSCCLQLTGSQEALCSPPLNRVSIVHSGT